MTSNLIKHPGNDFLTPKIYENDTKNIKITPVVHKLCQVTVKKGTYGGHLGKMLIEKKPPPFLDVIIQIWYL